MQQWSKINLILSTKKLAALVLCSLNICATPLLIDNGAVLSSEESGIRNIIKNKEDFIVITGQGAKKVKKHDVSRALKKMNDEQLMTFLNEGHGVIKADQFTNGDFKLDMHVRGNGGGAGGATVGVLVGKFTVSFLGHGTLHLIALCTGPAYVPTMAALELTAGPYIEAASLHAAAVCGLAGAVATGPV